MQLLQRGDHAAPAVPQVGAVSLGADWTATREARAPVGTATALELTLQPLTTGFEPCEGRSGQTSRSAMIEGVGGLCEYMAEYMGSAGRVSSAVTDL
eukprot:CAMPEP_0174733220 /NCGR_PEP_ID=MMETSP1094-20130205/60880_1 /TAXON_ID=156173 /ORGANISM="Chrysochromulina brevifilum, Strain UTEX LB 985" /LENGTH=96 /DNA_ID=CAMNT_0015935845 /DNA_START=498 /DNA_END=789 /DNA_ORIENTATION=-